MSSLHRLDTTLIAAQFNFHSTAKLKSIMENLKTDFLTDTFDFMENGNSRVNGLIFIF